MPKHDAATAKSWMLQQPMVVLSGAAAARRIVFERRGGGATGFSAVFVPSNSVVPIFFTAQARRARSRAAKKYRRGDDAETHYCPRRSISAAVRGRNAKAVKTSAFEAVRGRLRRSLGLRVRHIRNGPID